MSAAPEEGVPVVDLTRLVADLRDEASLVRMNAATVHALGESLDRQATYLAQLADTLDGTTARRSLHP